MKTLLHDQQKIISCIYKQTPVELEIIEPNDSKQTKLQKQWEMRIRDKLEAIEFWRLYESVKRFCDR